MQTQSVHPQQEVSALLVLHHRGEPAERVEKKTWVGPLWSTFSLHGGISELSLSFKIKHTDEVLSHPKQISVCLEFDFATVEGSDNKDKETGIFPKSFFFASFFGTIL